MKTATGSFVITEQDSADFAALSGDINPLHVDSTYARRLQFGSAVVHGVHHLLRALDHALTALGEIHPSQVSALSVSFPNPVRAGAVVEFELTPSVLASRAVLSATSAGVRVLAANLELAGEPRTVDGAPRCQNRCPPVESPIDQGFPPEHRFGECDLYLDESLAHGLFPLLAEAWTAPLLAQMLACTRIVGMRCPGLHSVFSSLELEIGPPADDTPPPQHLAYQVAHEDARFQMVRISVNGSELSGTLDAFYRPGPAEQPPYAVVRASVAPERFAGQRALVIGGSRGVGEVTAKILAAGGAQVSITYHTGAADAQAVAGELRAEGGNCAVLELDVTGGADVPDSLLAGPGSPTHVYMFASPKIAPSRGRRWNADLFAGYCRYYVQAFAELVGRVMATRPATADPVTFFYPSTIYVETPEKGFCEYACAKAAGEALCTQLARTYPKARFLAPRLPRMATDQTSSIIPVRCEPTVDIMLRELDRLP